MRSLLAPLALASLAPAVVGCTVGNSDVPDAEAQVSPATAIVVVERSTSSEGTRGDAIVARFVRARTGSVDDLALRTAGVQDLPHAAAGATTCVTSTENAAIVLGTGARAVDLLDVGAVSVVDAQSKTTVLLPRAMPDPAGVVSGYFYSARSGEAFTPTTRVSLRAGGGPDLPEGFAVTVAAPRDLGDVHVASSGGALDVRWDYADERDLVYIDVLAPSMIARCSALDAGRATVPASVLGGVEEGTLAVHRVHREPFRARGVDPGEVRFDVARVAPFRR